VLAELVLAADWPADAMYAALLSFAVSVACFRAGAPDESFPVSYTRGGTTAHLDLSGPRADAIVRAVESQLGLRVVEVEPFGLAGSGGSSPLRMTLEDGSRLFGKIYATSHARADRGYRVGRTILYGTLEDETPFGTPGGSPNTRTTRSVSWPTTACGSPRRTDRSSSRRTASTCSSPSSSRTRPTWATPTSTKR
jgi:hypothetical protein